MAKQAAIEQDGTIVEALSNAMFRVEYAEVPKAQTEAEGAKSQAETETGLSEPTKGEFLEIEKETEKESAEEILSEKITTPIPEASPEASDYVLRHASVSTMQMSAL